MDVGIGRIALLIFGMGRCGTSALSRVLSLTGGVLPDKVTGAGRGNERGHWEPRDALNLNSRFLAQHESTWFDPTLRLQIESAFLAEESEEFVSAITNFLCSCPGSAPLVIKEPRISALSHFWFEALRRAEMDVRIIIPVRHPAEVTASLMRRDGMSAELAQALWLKYNLLAERSSRTYPRIFVEFSNLIRDWRREIRRIGESLKLSFTLARAQEVEDFLSPALYHEQAEHLPDGDPFGCLRIYELFSAAADSADVPFGEMDEIYIAFVNQQDSFRMAAAEFREHFGPEPARTTGLLSA